MNVSVPVIWGPPTTSASTFSFQSLKILQHHLVFYTDHRRVHSTEDGPFSRSPYPYVLRFVVLQGYFSKTTVWFSYLIEKPERESECGEDGEGRYRRGDATQVSRGSAGGVRRTIGGT